MTLKDLCEVKEVLARITQLEAQLRSENQLNLNQAFALCCLSKMGPLSPTDLAQQLKISPPSLSRVLASLLELRLVEEIPAPVRRRHKALGLTPAGAALAEKLHHQESRLFPFPIL